MTGIKILFNPDRGGSPDLYFTNPALGLFAKVSLKANGSAAEEAQVLAHGDYDDFELAASGTALLTTGVGNSIVQVTKDGVQSVIAGGVNSSAIVGPTSAQLGTDGMLYVATSGGMVAPVADGGEDMRAGGQLVAVDLNHWE